MTIIKLFRSQFKIIIMVDKKLIHTSKHQQSIIFMLFNSM